MRITGLVLLSSGRLGCSAASLLHDGIIHAVPLIWIHRAGFKTLEGHVSLVGGGKCLLVLMLGHGLVGQGGILVRAHFNVVIEAW
jgi:hypothetical protein